jgi:hypothetical protein
MNGTRLSATMLALLITGCSVCPVPGGCAPVSHDPRGYESISYAADLTDATTGRIVSGYSGVDVSFRMKRGGELPLLVSPRGELGLITVPEDPAVGITVNAFGYQPYVSAITENERVLHVRLQPLADRGFVRYSGNVTDAATARGVRVRAARLYFGASKDRALYVYPDGTFDFIARTEQPPRRIAVVARGYAAYDADLVDGAKDLFIALRPVDGDEQWLGGNITDASTRNVVPVSAGVNGRIYFSDSTDELMWIEPGGAYLNAFMVSSRRVPVRIVVKAAGYETFTAELPPGQPRFDIALQRLSGPTR